MDNYEINILRRGGNWKKVKADDLIMDEINNKDTGYDKSEDRNQIIISYLILQKLMK